MARWCGLDRGWVGQLMQRTSKAVKTQKIWMVGIDQDQIIKIQMHL